MDPFETPNSRTPQKYFIEHPVNMLQGTTVTGTGLFLQSTPRRQFNHLTKLVLL